MTYNNQTNTEDTNALILNIEKSNILKFYKIQSLELDIAWYYSLQFEGYNAILAERDREPKALAMLLIVISLVILCGFSTS